MARHFPWDQGDQGDQQSQDRKDDPLPRPPGDIAMRERPLERAAGAGHSSLSGAPRAGCPLGGGVGGEGQERAHPLSSSDHIQVVDQEIQYKEYPELNLISTPLDTHLGRPRQRSTGRPTSPHSLGVSTTLPSDEIAISDRGRRTSRSAENRSFWSAPTTPFSVWEFAPSGRCAYHALSITIE
jgi:hypothetical protein